MATLERIRSKGVFLLIIIGLALLAFIIGDFLNNSSSALYATETTVSVGVKNTLLTSATWTEAFVMSHSAFKGSSLKQEDNSMEPMEAQAT